MRVITGKARGRRLETPVGNDVRPTTEVVKEAVFSVLQFRIEGRSFLDLFAGSGQMGIEALSRGASKAVFVDADKRSAALVKKNLDNTGLTAHAVVHNKDSIAFLNSCGEKFDIAFLDPPYQTGILQKALEHISRVMNKGGLILCEHPADEVLDEEIGDFVVKKQYKYGKIRITAYSHREVEGL